MGWLVGHAIRSNVIMTHNRVSLGLLRLLLQTTALQALMVGGATLHVYTLICLSLFSYKSPSTRPELSLYLTKGKYYNCLSIVNGSGSVFFNIDLELLMGLKNISK